MRSCETRNSRDNNDGEWLKLYYFQFEIYSHSDIKSGTFFFIYAVTVIVGAVVVV